ncbi:MAG: GNAT family N-acetyltransferase [Candidatus Thorarchaeota archaeon]|nr:GNAT family N-acetyltransferase [Candidatus Thorarchaeota archaeon]
MAITVRNLVIDDSEELERVSKSVWEDDYAPLSFGTWLEDPLWHPVGVFLEKNLVSFAALKMVHGTTYGWINALRTDAAHHKHGYGLMAVQKLIDIAREKGLSEVRYVTSSRNEASVKLAEKLGFHLTEKITSFKLSRPYPPRPKPSPSIVPLKADAHRVFETIQQYPDLMPTETIPVPFEFEDKNLEGFERIGKKVEFYLIIDDHGDALGLYYIRDFERKDARRRRVTIFSRDRSTFVDTIARVIEDTEKTEIDSLGFFLGPNASEWASAMMIIPEEMRNRHLVLLTLKL